MAEFLTHFSGLRGVSLYGAWAWARVHWQFVVLATLVVAGASVRMYDVADNPSGFFADEASFGLNAHLILTTGQDEYGEFLPLLFRSFGEYKLPAFMYAEMPFVAVFGMSELAVRLTAATIGSATIVTTYLMGRELFRRELPALASAAFLTILPWHVHYSRTGLGDIVTFPFALTIALYLFFKAMREDKPPRWAALAFGLTFYTYRASWVILPPLLLLLALLYHRELLKYRKQALQCAGIIFICLVPIMRHLLSDTTDRSSQAWIFDLHNGKSTLENFWEFYRSHFTVDYLFEKGDNGPITRHYLPGHGVLYWFMAPLILAGIARLGMQLNRRHAVLLALLFLFPLGAALSVESPHSSRAILGTVVFASLAAAGLWGAVELAIRVGKPVGVTLATGVVGVVALVAAVSFADYVKAYFDDYPRLSAGYWGWQDGPQAIMSKFMAVQDRYDDLFLDGTFNAPHIFIPFYTDGKCPKCRIGDSQAYNPQRRQLFALRPESLKPGEYEYVLRDEVLLAGNQPGFLLVEISRRR